MGAGGAVAKATAETIAETIAEAVSGVEETLFIVVEFRFRVGVLPFFSLD